MKRLRSTIFWAHLAAGTTGGLIILVMAATGAMLAFKPQILNLIERDVRLVEPQRSARLSPSQLLDATRARWSDAQPSSLVLDRDPAAAAAISLGRDRTVYVNPYTGAVLGEGSSGAQRFFRAVEDWHRWLSLNADHRASARAVTGAANLLFLGLAVSGLFLWWPHAWLPQHLRAILVFRRTSTGRARDFNWHNVVGFWCAPLLIVLTATGVVMSYPWANRLLYSMAGSPLPAAGERAPRAGSGGNRERAGHAEALPENLDRLWARAEQQLPTWRTVTMRLPDRRGAPVTFTMSDLQNWNAFARSQLTLNAETVEVVRWEPYAATSRGQKWRGWVRFGHTGELGGVAGQSLAAAACLGGVLLVWTGLGLAFRRLIGWRVWRVLAASPRVVSVTAADPFPER
jgi:uncharacterized iron-regulated membrane protein